MMVADTADLNSEVHARSTEIKKIEMDNIHQYTDGVAANAVLLCGFTAFFAVEPDEDTPPWLSGVYFCSAVISLSLNMYVVVTANLLGALGPTYGLNGKSESSMHEAVALMKKERKKMMTFFEFGAAFFGLCQLSATWVVADTYSSAICTAVLFLGFLYIWSETRRLKREFRFDEFHESEEAFKIANSCRAQSSRNGKIRKSELEEEAGKRMSAEKFLNSGESFRVRESIEMDPMSKTRR
ncbi:hypothetical protein TrST_g6632 [Triparma strigata]|uniref:Calcium release-activated calcium channel protein 1 n=1 Tax=Triparma strigata TaxID=1606541 RepID=A0A9W7AJB8_9STRA|nr:hypothetical protein TrST_g6632 [Triparma strigata]